MTSHAEAVKTQLARQFHHWHSATLRLRELESLASPAAWAGLERYLRLTLRQTLRNAVEHLANRIARIGPALRSASEPHQFRSLHRDLEHVRIRYRRVETLVEFYADAVNTRTNPSLSSILRGLDTLAVQSMHLVLDPLGKSVPPVLTYVDAGLGASILKAGLRLWDRRTASPAAVIKIVRHNLLRPTALIHETGHQVAHIVGWNQALCHALQEEFPGTLGQVWGSWASEVAADTFAFVHTGFASVAGLHDVVAGTPDSVFRWVQGDPHPISYLRVRLGVAMCRLIFGPGPWDAMEKVWCFRYPVGSALPGTQELIRDSLPLWPKIAERCLLKSNRAFAGQSLVALVDPNRVSPRSLLELKRKADGAHYDSPQWMKSEALRLLALSGLELVVHPKSLRAQQTRLQRWLHKLGGLERSKLTAFGPVNNRKLQE